MDLLRNIAIWGVIYCEVGAKYCVRSAIIISSDITGFGEGSRFPVAFFDIMYAKLANINMFLGIICELLCMFMEVLAR